MNSIYIHFKEFSIIKIYYMTKHIMEKKPFKKSKKDYYYPNYVDASIKESSWIVICQLWMDSKLP